MAVEAKKIKELLKSKFPGVNLSKQRQDAIADKLAPKLDKDEDIEPKLDELNELLPFADIAKQDDRLRTLEAKTKEPPKPSPASDDDDDDDEPAPDPAKPAKAKVPKYMKELLETVNSLKTEVTNLNSQKQQETIREKLTKHDKLKEIKPSFWNKRQLPTKEEEIDTFADEVATDHAAFLQESGYEGVTPHTPPASTGGKNVSKKPDPELVAFAKKQNEDALKAKA